MHRGSCRRMIIGLVLIAGLGFVGCTSSLRMDDQSLVDPVLSAPANVAQPVAKVAPTKVAKVAPTKAPNAMPAKTTWTLQECISYAIKNNEKIKSVGEKKQVKDGEVTEAWSDYLPTARFKYSHGNSNETGESDFYNISAKSMLWDCGKTKSKVKKIKAEKAMYAQDEKQTILDITYEVRKAYNKLLFQQYEVEAKRVALDSAKTNERDVRNRMDSGQAREVDLLGAKASIAQSEQELFAANNQYKIAQKRLNHYMGRPLTAPIKIQGKLTFQQIPLYRDKLTAKALAGNPKVKKLEKTIDKARFAKEGAHRRYFPTIYATGFFEYRDTKLDLFRGRAYGVGVEIELPVFRQIGIAAGQKKQARQMMRSAEQEYKNAKRQIAYTVDAVCNKMDEAVRAIYTAQQVSQYRNKMVDTIAKGLVEKVYQQKDLLEARKNQSQANVMLMKAIMNYNIAKAELDRVMGLLEK